MEEWEIAKCQAKEEIKTILKIRWMTIVEVSEGQQRGEFQLDIKHQDESVLMLVLTLEHHLHTVFQSFHQPVPAMPVLTNLSFVCM